VKHFSKDIDVAFQGDVTIIRVDVIPADAKKRSDKVAAHSETGHHHAFDASASVWLYSTKDDLVQYMEVKSKPVVLNHLREHDTHESWSFPPGNYKIIRQRERGPEGWRRVED
jgi:hypothetical protein